MKPRRPIVWMYSGQGSQYYAMAQELFHGDPVFQRTFLEVSDYAQRWTGQSIADLVYRYPGNRFDPFDRTLYTHPALFAVQLAMDRTLRAMGHVPDYVLGYSLGEFVALSVSGVLNWQDALYALLHQAAMLERNPVPGRMMAILGDPATFQDLANRFPGLELAAVNAPRHFVVTGSEPPVRLAQEWLTSRGVDAIILPVTQAFHSSKLEFTEGELRRLLESFPIGEPQTPVISSERGEIFERLNQGISWRITRGSIQFRKALDAAERSGPKLYVDLGPSGTLASFVRQNLSAGAASEALVIVTPFAQDQKNLQAVDQKLRRERSGQYLAAGGIA